MKYLIIIFFLISFVKINGQTINSNINALGQEFSELIKGNFDLIDSYIKTDTLRHTYLVFEIIPKQQGTFTITHTFSDIENANNNPTIYEKYTTDKTIKKINYKSKYVLAIYDIPSTHFYKYEDFYYSTNSSIAFNSVNDTILIPFILCTNCQGQKITFKKFENNGGWNQLGSEIKTPKDKIHINFVNNIKELELLHFKHSWGSPYHVIHKGTPGVSRIIGVFKAKDTGELNIGIGGDVTIPIEIVSKETPLKTHYGIRCERAQLYENEGALITTFHKVFTLRRVTLREGDIFSVKIKEFETRNGSELKLDTIIIEKENDK